MLNSFDYAVIRVVPRVEREEFINVGVILRCRERRFLAAKVTLDRDRLHNFAPWLDIDEIEQHLNSLVRSATGGRGSGPIGELSQAERFHWLVAPRSTMIQPSPVHSGLCDDPAAVLDQLMSKVVQLPESEPT